MTKEEQIALDQWREDEATRLAKEQSHSFNGWQIRQHEIYRELVVNDVRPPVVVDRAGECLAKVTLQLAKSDEDKATYIIRTYGDEQFAEGRAEGERAGIERALKWLDNKLISSREIDQMLRIMRQELSEGLK